MDSFPFLRMHVLTALTMFVGTAAFAQDGSPESLLKGRGLTRSGVYFLLDSEDEVIDAIKGLGPYIEAMEGAYTEYAEAYENETLFRRATDALNQITADIEKIDLQLRSLPNNNENRALRNELQQNRKILESQKPDAKAESKSRQVRRIPPARLGKLERDYQAENLAYYSASKPVLELYEKLTKNYKDLSLDNSVKAALAAIGRSPKEKGVVKLGPSKELQQASSRLKDVEEEHPPFKPHPRDTSAKKGASSRKNAR